MQFDHGFFITGGGKRVSLTQILRHMVQVLSFLLLPGLFLTVFQSLRDVVVALVAGSFSFSVLSTQLLTLLIVLGVTALWGRFFCGWLCSFGALQELTAFVSNKLLPRKRKLPAAADRILKYAKYAILLTLILAVWVLQLPVDSSMSPWGIFGMLVSGNWSVMRAAIPTIGFALLAGILIASFFAERFFCRYLCPLGAIFTPISAGRLFRIRRKESLCSNCGRCSRACAMGVNVPEGTHVRSGECIDCMRCTETCAPAALYANPNPAIAGTATALVMCGMISVGRILPAGEGTSDPIAVVSTDASAALRASVSGYTDGVYTGSGTGFRGTVSTQVTVENGKITDITVLSYQDDAAYFRKASSGVIAAILSEQTPQVSAVSGATFSSRGIMESVADALQLEDAKESVTQGSQSGEMNGGMHMHHGTAGLAPDGQRGGGAMKGNRGAWRSDEGSAPVPPSAGIEALPEDTQPAQQPNEQPAAAAEARFIDGTYTGTGTGYRGQTQVSVTVEDGKITDITVLSYADDNQFFSRAESGVIEAVIRQQSVNVQTVSGATFSSNGILEAVADALDLEYSNPSAGIIRGNGKKAV